MNERRWRKSWLARLLRLDYGVSPTSVHRARGRVSHLPERVRVPRVALKPPVRRQFDEPADAVIHALEVLNPDPEKVAKHMKETRIRVLGGRTIEEAMSDGEFGKVLRYLRTISGGQNG